MSARVRSRGREHGNSRSSNRDGRGDARTGDEARDLAHVNSHARHRAGTRASARQATGVTRTLAARTAAVSAFAFAGLLGYTAAFRDSSVFDGFSALRLMLTLLFVAICVAYLVWLRHTMSSAEPERATFARTVAPG